jgi:hypothetical protein
MSSQTSSTLVPPAFTYSNTNPVTLTVSGNQNNLLNGTFTASSSSFYNTTPRGPAYAFTGYQLSTNATAFNTNTATYGTNGIYAAPVVYIDIGNSLSYSGSGTLINDLSGNGYNYNTWNSPTYSSNSLNFTAASSQYIYGVPLQTLGSGSYSVEVWINPSATSGVVVDENNFNGWHTSIIELISGTIYARVYNGTTLNLGTFSTGTWYQIVLVYDHVNLTQLGYVNGTFKSSNSVTRSVPNTPVAYLIGNSDSTNLGNGTYYSGKFQTLLVYNTALTAAGVLNNYNYFSPRIISAGTVSGNIMGVYTTTVNNTVYKGEWLQLQVPNAISINSFIIQPQQTSTFYLRTPTKFVLAGSVNGTTWQALHIQGNTINNYTADVSWSNSSIVQKFICNQNNFGLFNYFRLIIQAINSGNDQYAAIGQLSFYTNPPTPRGLLDGLTWKFYDGTINNNSTFATSYYSSYPYTAIGRCVDTSNYRTITNGIYQGNATSSNYTGTWSNPQNCGTEIFGYFKANVTGTWTFYLWGDDYSYLWIGNNALSGYTTSNYNIYAPYTTSAVTSCTISLIAGVYYPIRIQHYQGVSGLNLQFSFQPPSGGITSNGQGFFFSGTGNNYAFPQESAKIIKDLTNTNTDGIYYILVNGISTPTYCLMNDIYDGGGWMMLMKMSTNTTAFYYSSNNWKYANTLNANDVNRNIGDSKYNVFNYAPVKDILGIWPDISPTSYTNPYGNNGGSFFTPEGWVWLLNNWSSGKSVTALSGFSTSRPAGIYTSTILQNVGINNPFYYNGFGTWCSYETGSYLHYINAFSGTITGGTGASPGSTTCNKNIRWGFIFNNETTDLNSIDAYCGIGMDSLSAGDYINGLGSTTVGINRSARFELYGR